MVGGENRDRRLEMTMTIDMRLVDPDRNRTDRLWRSLEKSAALPTVFVGAAICASGFLRYDGAIQIVGVVILSLLIVMAVSSSLSQRRIVKELKRRYEEASTP